MVRDRRTSAIAAAFFLRLDPPFTYPQSIPQVAKTAVEMLKKEISANCGHDLFRPLDPFGEDARLPLAPSTERK
jgi:hypothetical protein